MKKVLSPSASIGVFDVDRTLIIGTSVEIQLVGFLVKKKLLPSANLMRALFWIPRLMRKGLKEAILRNKFYLYGLDVRMIHSLLPEFFECRLNPLFSRKMTARMNQLKAEGYSIIFISGTLDFIIDFLIDRFKADGGMGTEVEIVNGRFTGRVRGIYPFHWDKVKALQTVLDGTGVNFPESYGFADSWADIPLLSMFGHPIAMNPDWGLKREAYKHKWEIETESEPY